MMTASPLRGQEEQLKLLTLHLRFGRGGLLIVATPDAEAERALAEELRLLLSDEVIIEEVTFAPVPVERLSLSHHLSTLPEPLGKAAVFVFGLDDLPLDARTTAINAMNWGRERLRWAGYTVVLWVRSGTPGELGNHAPDFFSWRSDVFEFNLSSDPAERQRLLAELRLFAPSTLAELRQRYCDYVLRICQWLDFRGLLQVRNVVRLPLDEVFIPLQATPPLNYTPPPPSPKASGVDSTDYPVRERYYTERRVALNEVVGHQRFVVLGDPGSGKSTLLRFLALAFARGKPWVHEHLGVNEDRLPILTPLSAFSEARKAQSDLSLVEFLPRYFSGQGLPDFAPVFEDALRNGHGLVLLDGLDEMLTYEDRADVARSIANFANTYPTARVVVTSRVPGYVPGMLPTNFATFTLAPFNDDAIEQFARQWSRAFETIGFPSQMTLPPDVEQRAILRAESLVAAVTGHPGVWRLATNPLLLTLLALIHYQGTRLPHRRVDLYRLCVEALAETWNLARSLTRRPIDIRLGERRLDEAFVVRILSPIAYWMHETKPTGLVERGELEARISEQFVESEGISSADASTLAHDFLDLVREQMGLLVERAPSTFSFLHLSVQEYLTARFLSERIDGFERLKHHLHRPRWREVVLLTAGCLRGDYVTKFVEDILNAHSPFNDLSCRLSVLLKDTLEKTVTLKTLLSIPNLLVAASCIGDDVSVRPLLCRQICEALITLWRHLPFQGLSFKISWTFSHLKGSPHGPDMLRFFLNVVRDHGEDKHLRGRAAEMLGIVWPDEAQVMETLLSLVHDLSENNEMRAAAVSALRLIQQGEAQVVETLQRIVYDRSEDKHVRGCAVGKLGFIEHDEGEAVLILHNLICDRSEDKHVRGCAVETFRFIEHEGGEVTQRILRNLVRDRREDKEVRASAARMLGSVTTQKAQVVRTLLGLLRDRSEDKEVRASAAEGLWEINWGKAKVIETLLSLVRDHSEDKQVRGSAAETLGLLGQGEARVIETLLGLVRDRSEDKQVRADAAWALGIAGHREPRVVQTLLGLVRNRSEDEHIRRQAVNPLGLVGLAESKVIKVLLQVADEPALRAATLEALYELLERVEDEQA